MFFKASFALLFWVSYIIDLSVADNEWIYNLTAGEAANLVREEFIYGYQAYKDYAWGTDELLPITKNGTNWSTASAMITPIDSLGTMAIMGITDLLDDTLDLLCNHGFTFMLDQNINMFEIVIRDLGGLVSAYHFVDNENNECIKRLAIELGDAIYQTAFIDNPATIEDLPWIDINILANTVNRGWNVFAPAGLGSNIIEFGALSYITNDNKYYTMAKKTMRKLYDLRVQETGLIGGSINITVKDQSNLRNVWPDESSHIDAQIDSLYEYQIKCYLLFNDTECLQWWKDGWDSISRYMQYYDEFDNLWFQRVDMFTGDLFDNDSIHSSFTYDLHAHFFSATMALDDDIDITLAEKNQNANDFMWDLHEITPFLYDFHNKIIINPNYNLNPEIFESNYYLYCATDDPKYLERAYEYLHALITYTKCTNTTECVGYSGLSDVRDKSRSNTCPSYWFAESLKFLYLTFMKNEADNTFNFDEYIFNTEAHPIPIKWGMGVRDEFVIGDNEKGDLEAIDIWSFANIYIFTYVSMAIALYMMVLLCVTKLVRGRNGSKYFDIHGGGGQYDEYNEQIDNELLQENDVNAYKDWLSNFYSSFYSFIAMLCLLIANVVIVCVQTDVLIEWDYNENNEEWDVLKWSWLVMCAFYFLFKIFQLFSFSYSINSASYSLIWSRILIVIAIMIALVIQCVLNDSFVVKKIIRNNDSNMRDIFGVDVDDPIDTIFSVLLILMFAINIILVYVKQIKKLKLENQAMKAVKNDDVDSNDNVHESSDYMSQKQQIRIYLTMKHFLLLWVFTISTCVCMILWVIFDEISANQNNGMNFGFFFPCFDMLISSICVVLMYHFHERFYQCLCRSCHMSCNKMHGLQQEDKESDKQIMMTIRQMSTGVEGGTDKTPLMRTDDKANYQ